ncbi:hypothetical protein [Brevibacillus sp. SYSU BS000544]|uniref:hypothetical protein n=1 Tax=Brevibacillus sp. SYSU BS000544 TaxID=3416443 RepID=UPI003CE4716E
MDNRRPIEALLWCIAFPGFGQFLNGKYFKGVVLLFLEFVINMGSHLNQVIRLSFLGEIQQAIEMANFQWLMFYPCVYMFGIWDAYKDAGGGRTPIAYLPFVLSAYFGTVGVIYSSQLQLFNVLLGPVWLPMLFAFCGIAIGILVRYVLIKTIVR